MDYKELLESGEPVYRETTRFKHFKNPVTSERYFSNYLSYKRMPSLSEVEADLAYLAHEQAGYVSNYAFLFFAENQEISAELEDYLKKLSIYKLSIFQPSLLIGKRSEVRLLEDTAQTLFKLVEKTWTKPFKYKPISAEQLAHTMVIAAQTQSAAFKLYDNLAIQQTQ